MAKFLKSIFQPNENRRSVGYDAEGSEEERSHEVTQAMEERRKLSISRSGRMKQAQKKRLSLSLDIYGGDIDITTPEKPKSVEYHVSQLAQSRENPLAPNQRRRSRESLSSTESGKVRLRSKGHQIEATKVPRVCSEIKTPDEEIDNAFDVIEKS